MTTPKRFRKSFRKVHTNRVRLSPYWVKSARWWLKEGVSWLRNFGYGPAMIFEAVKCWIEIPRCLWNAYQFRKVA